MTKCDPDWGTFFHYTQDRIISIREAARLQSFSDWFKFTGSSIQEFMAARFPNLPPGCLKTWLSYERSLGLTSLFLVLSLSACSNLAALRPEPWHINGFQETHHISAETITNLAASNNKKLLRYKKEHEYRKGTPKYCLSLSGGGVRSAWYSIGVMKALAKAKRLDSLDVISATSGGSYALGWYYSAMLREIDNKSIPDTGIGRDAALFEGQAYRDLEKSYDVVFKTDRIPSGEDNWIEQGLIAIYSFAISPFGLLGPPGDSFGREMYQKRIDKAFHVAPLTLKDVGDKVVKYQLPIFIIAATAQGNNMDSVPLSNTVFEYTPFFKGSDGTGYTDKDTHTKIGEVIATAGAALGSPLKHRLAGHARNYSGITLGHAERPYDKESHPLSYYYLSDGGHSDNLALLPLIRRHCENIIIVDAEEDPNFMFESYAILKKTLQAEYATQLSVPNIDEHLDNRNACFTSDISWKFPVSFGQIRTLPVLDEANKAIDQRPLNITYLKLSFDSSTIPAVSRGDLDEDSMYKEMRTYPNYPHYPTINQYAFGRSGRLSLAFLGFEHASAALEHLTNHRASEQGRN